MKIPKRIAQTLMGSLKGGVVPRVGLPYITVGRKAEIDALLRDVDSFNPNPFYAELEEELLNRINALGIGHMGAGGRTSVLAFHVEYSYTHIAGVAVATSTNCCVARRGTVRLTEDSLEILPNANWFGGR